SPLSYIFPFAHVALFFFLRRHSFTTSPLSLHDALPISRASPPSAPCGLLFRHGKRSVGSAFSAKLFDAQIRGVGRIIIYNIFPRDRKSTRLNSSHVSISYAVFCLKKKRIIYKKDKLIYY